MSVARVYEAVADFSLNLDNGAKQLSVRIGDELMFDGVYVTCGSEKGQAHSLAKVIGEWIVLKSGQEPPPAPVRPAPIAHPRNATGGKIIEDSDVSQDLGVRMQQEDSHQELKRLVDQYENAPAPSRIQDDERDMRREASQQRPLRVKVEDQDAQEVAKVRSTEESAVKNTSGVEIASQEKKGSTVISQEERVVKSTQYVKKADDPTEPKHLKVDKEASGVEVRRVKVPAIQKTEMKTGMKVDEDSIEVSQMDYIEEPTVVGSTTQAQVVKSAVMAKTASKPVATAKRATVADIQSQDGVVVRKVSAIKEETSQGGITSRVTVGASGEVDHGEVTFSSNSDIDEGEVTFSKGEDSIVDLGGGNVAGDDMNIDIDGLLDS
jgi:hypothetical protein